jgi:hypothetical protein
MVTPSPAPKIVRLWKSAGVSALVVSVNVDDVLAGFGLKVAVAPLGRPLNTLKVTGPMKPFDGVMVIAYVVLLPAAIVCWLGDTFNVKLGPAGSVSVTVIVLLTLPLLPVILTV